jgi:glycosyltransferase involved in cell wall biosynthesis
MLPVSAVIRLKDEAEWLPYCLESIQNHFAEIILVTQGAQSDKTPKICIDAEKKFGHIRYYHYEYECWPNGPGFEKYPMRFENRAFFYNWAFSKATNPWVCKWDGDMIAMDGFEKVFQRSIKSQKALKFHGVNVVRDVYHVGENPFCAAEPRLYKNGYYTSGSHSEKLVVLDEIHSEQKPLFIHTKWAKSQESITKAWPKNWATSTHFQNLWKRYIPKTEHQYELPLCIRK